MWIGGASDAGSSETRSQVANIDQDEIFNYLRKNGANIDEVNIFGEKPWRISLAKEIIMFFCCFDANITF